MSNDFVSAHEAAWWVVHEWEREYPHSASFHDEAREALITEIEHAILTFSRAHENRLQEGMDRLGKHLEMVSRATDITNPTNEAPVTKRGAIQTACELWAYDGTPEDGAIAFEAALAEHGFVVMPKELTPEMKLALIAHFEKYPASTPEPKAIAWDFLHCYRALVETSK